MKIKTAAIKSTATFSECGLYRYSLQRLYGAESTGIINFIMLNPSTADAEWNDNTVAKCERITLAHGYNHMIITNLFAYRATAPSMMKAAQHRPGGGAVGEDNDKTIQAIAAQANAIVCAWGNHGGFIERSKHVRALLKPYASKLYTLALNQSSEPKHPLYVLDKSSLQPWPMAGGA